MSNNRTGNPLDRIVKSNYTSNQSMGYNPRRNNGPYIRKGIYKRPFQNRYDNYGYRRPFIRPRIKRFSIPIRNPPVKRIIIVKKEDEKEPQEKPIVNVQKIEKTKDEPNDDMTKLHVENLAQTIVNSELRVTLKLINRNYLK